MKQANFTPRYEKWKLEDIVLNTKLQELSQQVSYLCVLEIKGKLSSQEVHQQIKTLWKQFKQNQETHHNFNQRSKLKAKEPIPADV